MIYTLPSIKDEKIAATLISSVKCNLKCKYCVLHQNQTLSKIHKDLVDEKFTTENILKALEQLDTKITSITLWGGEPTLYMDRLAVAFPAIMQRYPLLDAVSTSTNLANSDNIIKLIDAIDIWNKKMTCRIQVSIDGPNWMNKHNRGVAVEHLYHQLNKILERTKTINDKLVVSIAIKGTYTMENIEILSQDKEKCKEFIDFTWKMHKSSVDKYAKKNVHISLFGLPTLGMPGTYDKEDGMLYGQYYNNMFELKDYVKELTGEPLSVFDTYSTRMKDAVEQHDLRRTLYIQMCSAGECNLVTSMDGTVTVCHDTLYGNYPEFIKEYGDGGENEYAYNMDGKTFEKATMKMTASGKNRYEMARLEYVMSAIRYSTQKAIDSNYAMIKVLSKCGQINKRFAKDESMAMAFSYFMALNVCFVHNKILTGEYLVTPMQLFNIYGNGMFERIYENYREERKIHQ